MGMTDRQFDSYQKRLLTLLEIVKEEIKEKGETKRLDGLIEELKAELLRP